MSRLLAGVFLCVFLSAGDPTEARGVGATPGGHHQSGRALATTNQNPGLVYPPDAAILLGALKAWTEASSTVDCMDTPVLPTTWNVSSSCVAWEGVACDGSGRVEALDLGGHALCGSIPSLLANLYGLTRLNLGQNQLSGPIPSNIGKYNKGYLDLSDNKLSGSLPSSIFKDVKYLDLSSNKLTGSLPNSIGSVTGSIWLDRNMLSGSLPSSIGNIGITGQLKIFSNELTGSLPSSISNLNGILDLSNNMLTGPLPSSIGKSGYLRIDANLLTGSVPPLFGDAHERWNVRDNFLSGICPNASAWSASGNCFRNCSFTMRNKEECSKACGSDQATGPCLGRGKCFFIGGPYKNATCNCSTGFVTPASSPGACVRAPSPPPGYIAKLCVGAVTDPKKCKCPSWARCQRKSFCNNMYVCRCIGVKRRPVTDPKTGILKTCV